MKQPPLQETILDHLRAAGVPVSSRDLAARFLRIRHDDESTCHRLLEPLLGTHPAVAHLPGRGWSFQARPAASGAAPLPGPPVTRPAAVPVANAKPAAPQGGDSPLGDFVALASEGAGPGGSGVVRSVSMLPVVAGEPCREEHLPGMEENLDDTGGADSPLAGLGREDLQTLVETIGDLPIVCHRAAREATPLLRACAAAGIPFHPVVISAARLGHLMLDLKRSHASIDLAAALKVESAEPDDSRGRARLVALCFLELIPLLQQRGVGSIEALQEFQNLPAAPLDFAPYAFTADDLRALPPVPGVYRFLDRHGALLYIGKAKNLRHRVGSYFTPSSRATARGRAVLEQVHALAVETAASELEALLIEAALLLEHHPPLNRQFDVHQRPAPYGPYINLAVVLPDAPPTGGGRPAACTVHLVREGRYLMRIGGVDPAAGATSGPPARLEKAITAAYFPSVAGVPEENPPPGSAEIDWQLVATFVRKHIDQVNVLDFDDCDSPSAAMQRLRVLVAAAASGERVVAR